MSFTEKLKLIIDVDSTGATSGLSGLKSKVSEAEGVFGKLKAGASGLKDAFADLSPAAKGGLAAGGVTAVGAAAFEAVTKFEDLGLKVGEFSDKTGLSTQESSRWVEVADQMGLSAEDLEGVLGKMNKSLDPNVWKQYGIEIARTKDGTVDVNKSFLNAIDHLHNVSDATERAKEGAKLFGKGWTTVSELVADGADVLKGKLNDVADVKILSAKDVQDARNFRDAMDDLKDVGEELVLTLGKALLPAFTGVAEAAKEGAPAVQKLGDLLGGVVTFSTNNLKNLGGAAQQAGHAFGDLWDSSAGEALSGDVLSLTQYTTGLSKATSNMSPIVADAADRQAELDQRFKDAATSAQLTSDAVTTARHAMQALGETTPEVAGLKETIDGLARPMDDASAAASALDRELTKLFGGTIDLKEGERAYIASVQDLTKSLKENKNSFDDNTQAGRDNKDAIDKSIGTIKDQSVAMLEQGFTTQEVTDYINGHVASLVAQSSQSAKTRAKVQEYIDTLNLTPEQVETAVKLAGDDIAKQKIQEHIGELDKIPASKATEIQALIDEGSYAAAANRLEVLARNRTMNISIQARGGPGYNDTGTPHFAAGGPVRAGEVALVGERGPEIVAFGASGNVIPAGPTSQILSDSGGSVVHNYYGDMHIHVDRPPTTERELSQVLAKMNRLSFHAA